MKDIPFFQWEGCVATLALSEIPYRQKAYILVRLCPEEKLRPFIAECAAFCRVAGAKKSMHQRTGTSLAAPCI